MIPSPSATEATSPSAAPTPIASTGDFIVTPNAAADALFLQRDSCENLDDGYRLEFPDAWYTNTAVGDDVAACRWFGPEAFVVDDPDETPDRVAIEIFVVPGARGYDGDILSRDDVIVGGTQIASRIEATGTSEGADGTSYEFVVQLGPSADDGPNLVARTDTTMAGEYEVNKAVLDRMMATIEFLGSIE